MAVDPNEGASKQRAEELKQANIEGAKFKATMEGLNAVFKDFAKGSKEALKADAALLGQLDGMGKGFKKAVGLADKLKGFTLSDLKNAKQRNAFQNALTAAQGDQARVAADMAILEETITDKFAQRRQLKKDIAKDEAKVLAQQAESNLLLEEMLARNKKQEQTLKDIEKLEKERSKLTGDAASALQEKIDKSYEEFEILVQTDDIASKAATKRLDELNKQLDSTEEVLNSNRQIKGELEGQLKAATGVLKGARGYKKTIDQTVDSATDLSEKIDDVEKAGNSLLKSFSKFGSEIAGTLPVLGGAFQMIFGELGNSQTLFEDAVAKGTSKAGAYYEALTGTIKALTMGALLSFAKLAFEGAKNASEAFKIVQKGLGGGLISASAAMKSASGAASAMGIPLQEAAGYIGQMNDALGTSLGFSAKQVTTFGTLTRNMGVSGEAAAKLFKFAVKTGTSYEDMAANVAGTTEKLNAMNGTAVAPKAVFEEMGSASQTILRNMKDNPDALIKAAAGARAMGLEMNRIADAAESTLDFESSMAKEMEAELMLGKDLNLDKLRAAAATGDQVTMQEEMKRLVLENKDALEGNVLAQGMMADTLGISKEELNKMLNTTEDQAKMAEQDAARKKANAENEKKTARELGQQQLTLFKRVNSLADRIAKFQESLALGAKNFFDAFMNGIKPLTNLMRDVFDADGATEKLKVFAKGIFPALKASLGNLGTLVKDSLLNGFKGLGDAISKEGDSILSKGGILGKMLGGLVLGGAGLTIALKGVKGLKNAFGFLTGKKKGMDNVEVIRGAAKVTMAGSGPMDLLGNKGRAGLFKQFKTLFKKPKVFFRALKMKGGTLGKIVGNIGSRLSNIKFPKLGNIFSKIKLPNLTKIFSRIKLPNLTNIFSKLKMPKLPNVGSGLKNVISKIKLPNVGKGFTNLLSKVKIPSGAASGILKTVGGKILAPLELAMGAFKGVNQVKDLTAEQKKEQGIKESMGTTEAGILGALTGNANKGSSLSGMVGIEKGSAGDEALGIATSTARGAATGAAIGSIIPGVGTAIGAAVGGAVGFVSEGFKVFSDPNSKLRQGLSNFASSTWDKAKEIGSKVKDTAKAVGSSILSFGKGLFERGQKAVEKVKDFGKNVAEKAMEVGGKIKDFAVGVKDKAVAFASSVGEGITNFASAAGEKISNFASSVGEGISNFASAAGEKISNFGATVGAGIMSFASSARDKAAAFAGAVGEKIGNIRGKIGEFLEANDGLVGGIKAAASGIASRAKEMLGSAWKGIKNFVTGGDSDKSKDAAPEIKEAEIKKVTTPLVQMSSTQSKELVTAINASMLKGAESTVQAVNAFGDHLEPFITDSKESANAQLHELKQLTKEQNEQYKKQMIELQNQTAALFQIATKKDNIIKMDSFRVGKAITSRY